MEVVEQTCVELNRKSTRIRRGEGHLLGLPYNLGETRPQEASDHYYLTKPAQQPFPWYFQCVTAKNVYGFTFCGARVETRAMALAPNHTRPEAKNSMIPDSVHLISRIG